MASPLTVEQELSTDGARPRPRPVAPRRRRVRERISLGHLFMIAAALLAFVLVVSLLSDRRETVQVLVAAADIQPGAAITAEQVRLVDLPADSDLTASLATMGAIEAGATAAQRIDAGDPITMTALAPGTRASGLRAMSLPIGRSVAVGGDLAAGDRIDVISVEGTTARYVAVDLEVLRTQASAAGTGALTSSALTDYYITVSVDDQTALQLALALDTGEVSILRSTGASPVPPERRSVAAVPVLRTGGTSGDLAGSGSGGGNQPSGSGSTNGGTSEDASEGGEPDDDNG